MTDSSTDNGPNLGFVTAFDYRRSDQFHSDCREIGASRRATEGCGNGLHAGANRPARAIAALILIQWLTGEAMEDVFRSLLRGLTGSVTLDAGAWAHLVSGLAVLVLLAVRLALRFWRGVPPPPEELSALLASLAKVAHWAFYVVLALLPVSGLIALYVAPVADGAHGFLFNLLILLLILHVAAVAYHQIVLRDGLLRRMLVPVRPRSQAADSDKGARIACR